MATTQTEKNGAFTGIARYRYHYLSKSGFRLKADALDWARDIEDSWKSKGAPRGDGPTKMSLARALLEMALIQLPYKKGAPQEARRINQYLLVAGMPLLWVTSVQGEEDAAAQESPGGEKLNVGVRRFNVELLDKKEIDARSKAKGGCQRSDPKSKSMRYRKVLGAMTMSEIQTCDIQHLVTLRLAEGRQVQTVLHDVAIIRELFTRVKTHWNWLRDRINPALEDNLDLPDFNNDRERIPTPTEEQRVMDSLHECYDYRKPLGVAFLAASAMRCTEALVTARWMDVDLEAGVIHLREDKAGGGRTVPLTIEAKAILLLLKRGRPEATIFATSYNSLKKAFERACRRAGIKNLHLHDMRHVGATALCIRLNGNIEALKVATGHLTDSQLARYVHLTAIQVAALLRGEEIARPGDILISEAIKIATANQALTPEELSKKRRWQAQLRAGRVGKESAPAPAVVSNIESLQAFRKRAA